MINEIMLFSKLLIIVRYSIIDNASQVVITVREEQKQINRAALLSGQQPLGICGKRDLWWEGRCLG